MKANGGILLTFMAMGSSNVWTPPCITATVSSADSSSSETGELMLRKSSAMVFLFFVRMADESLKKSKAG